MHTLIYRTSQVFYAKQFLRQFVTSIFHVMPDPVLFQLKFAQPVSVHPNTTFNRNSFRSSEGEICEQIYMSFLLCSIYSTPSKEASSFHIPPHFYL
jgi:hypothetical protein